MPEAAIVETRSADTPSSVGVIGELKLLFHQSAHYLAGMAASLAIGFVSFPVFTRAFSVADYGTIDFVQKIVLVFVAASKMGQQYSALRFYDPAAFASNPAAAHRYYSTLFFGIATTAAVVSLLFAGGAFFAPLSLLGVTVRGLVGLAVALIFFKALGSVLYSFMRIEEKSKRFAIVSASHKAFTVAAVCILLPFAGASPFTFLSAQASVELLFVAIFSSLLLRRALLHFGSFDVSVFRDGLAFGMPLIIYEIASQVLDSGDRVLVRYYLGGDALGQYSVAYGLAAYVNDLLIAPLNLALLPIYMRLWRTDGQRKTSEFLSFGLDLFLLCAAGVIAVAISTAQVAVHVLASAKYGDVGPLSPVIVAGLLIYTTHVFFAAGLLIHRNTRVMATLLVYSAILNLGLNMLLLPRIGLMGAAVATTVSYVFCLILLARASFKVLPLRIDLRAWARYATASLIAAVTASRVSVGAPALSLVARGVTAGVVYAGILYLVDRRIRKALVWLADALRSGAWNASRLSACETAAGPEVR